MCVDVVIEEVYLRGFQHRQGPQGSLWVESPAYILA